MRCLICSLSVLSLLSLNLVVGPARADTPKVNPGALPKLQTTPPRGVIQTLNPQPLPPRWFGWQLTNTRPTMNGRTSWLMLNPQPLPPGSDPGPLKGKAGQGSVVR
jgi:hypothetical protein